LDVPLLAFDVADLDAFDPPLLVALDVPLLAFDVADLEAFDPPLLVALLMPLLALFELWLLDACLLAL
jgi:hypothetical protein